MGIIDFLTKQFIDVIDWTEPEEGILAYRYPMQDREIQNGAQLTVRDSQLALFVNEGQVADLFKPGLSTLTTRTLPILTNLKNWDKAFASPFKSDVYFFSTREQLDQKWGTPTALTIRDKEFGAIRVQAYGIYSYKIEDPKTFYLKISGSRDVYRTEELAGQLRATVLGTIGSILGTGEVAFVDMAANQLKLAATLKSGLEASFANYGLSLQTFQVQSVSLPEELQKRLDERAGINIVGNLNTYTQYQAAKSISAAAENQSGIAGAGAAMGAGVGIGQVMAQAMGGALAGGGAAGAKSEDVFATIEKLHELSKKGIITAQEYEAKKAELLKKIG